MLDDFLQRLGGTLFEPGSQHFEFPLLIAEGTTVVLEWRVSARAHTGVAYENEYCGVFVVDDGHIREVREYLDTRYAARILFPETHDAA